MFRKTNKLFGIIALAAVIGFGMTSCDNGGGGPGYPDVGIDDIPSYIFTGTASGTVTSDNVSNALQTVGIALVNNYRSFYDSLYDQVPDSVNGPGDFTYNVSNASFSSGLNISNNSGTITGSLSQSEAGYSVSGKWDDISYDWNPTGYNIPSGFTAVKATYFSAGSFRESGSRSGYNHSESHAIVAAFIFDSAQYKGRGVLSLSSSVSYNQNSTNPNVKLSGKITIYGTSGDTPLFSRNLTKEETDAIISSFQ
jgi:hypothetical protein